MAVWLQWNQPEG